MERRSERPGNGTELFSVDTLTFTQTEFGRIVARSLRASFHADTGDGIAQLVAIQKRVANQIAGPPEDDGGAKRTQVLNALHRFELAVRAKSNSEGGVAPDISGEERERTRWEYEDAYDDLKEVLAIKE